jgi:hypothetical protein
VIVAHDGTEAARRDPHNFHTVLYANVIPPSQSDVVRYQFHGARRARPASRSTSSPTVKWRKFKQPYVDYIFDGKTKPEMPITQIAGGKVTLKVGNKGETARPTAGAGLRRRRPVDPAERLGQSACSRSATRASRRRASRRYSASRRRGRRLPATSRAAT